MGTCDNDAKRNRTRSFTNGTTPCTGNSTEVGSCSGAPLTKINDEAKMLNLFNLKLKAHGQHGTLGALVLVLVIVMLNGTEQGTSQVVTYLVLEV